MLDVSSENAARKYGAEQSKHRTMVDVVNSYLENKNTTGKLEIIMNCTTCSSRNRYPLHMNGSTHQILSIFGLNRKGKLAVGHRCAVIPNSCID